MILIDEFGVKFFVLSFMKRGYVSIAVNKKFFAN